MLSSGQIGHTEHVTTRAELWPSFLEKILQKAATNSYKGGENKQGSGTLPALIRLCKVADKDLLPPVYAKLAPAVKA